MLYQSETKKNYLNARADVAYYMTVMFFLKILAFIFLFLSLLRVFDNREEIVKRISKVNSGFI